MVHFWSIHGMAALPAGAGTRRLGSVLELHAFRTDHHVGRAEGMQLTCGDEVPGPGAHISPAADARLGASSLLTSYSVRGGRVCSLKRVDPSKVMSELSLGGLGLTDYDYDNFRTEATRRTTRTSHSTGDIAGCARERSLCDRFLRRR